MFENEIRVNWRSRTKLALSVLFFSFSLFTLNFEPHTAIAAELKVELPMMQASLGDHAVLYVDVVYDAKSRSQVNVTLRKVGTYANIYVEDDYWVNSTPDKQATILNQVNNLADEFDQKIYPRVRDVFGSEWNPGIDNDPKINILLANIINEAGGYFNPNDEYFKDQVVDGRSNEREILYLNIVHLGDSRLRSFLAHEFQHMINWYQKNKLHNVDEEVWLNEALSEYAPTAAGLDAIYFGSNLESRVNTFLKTPSDALTDWQNTSQDYGSVNLFIQYLADQYGTGVLKYIVADPSTGTTAINDALKKAGYNDTFSDVFHNWVIADLLNNPSIASNPKYSYKNQNLTYINFHVTPTAVFQPVNGIKVGGTFNSKEWTPRWYSFTSVGNADSSGNTNSLKIEFSSTATGAKFSAPYAVYHSTGTVTVGYMDIDTLGKGSSIINNFGGDAIAVVIMPTDEYSGKTNGLVSYTLNAEILVSDEPIISNVVPNRSLTSGGVLTTIRGANFTNTSKVFFGDKEVASPKIVDSGTIEVVSPPLNAGQVDVKVVNSDSKDYTLPKALTYFSFADGTLIRAFNDYKVYIINGRYKRWIQSSEIFNFYQHLDWSRVVITSPDERDAYQNAALVRAANDYKVYEINGDLTKHWVNINAQEFIVSGRRWDMVQIVNEKERDFYRTGADIR